MPFTGNLGGKEQHNFKRGKQRLVSSIKSDFADYMELGPTAGHLKSISTTDWMCNWVESLVLVDK